jgi:transglutaminase-like putative cysteine protease
VYLIKGEGDGATLYSDTKTYRFTFTGLERNAIVEYRYSIRKDYAFRNDQWFIQNSLPTMRNRYRLTVPRFLVTDYKWSWNYKPYNYSEFPPLVVDNPEISETQKYKAKIRYIWDLRDIPAFEPDPMMPPYSLYWAQVKFSPETWKKWDDIAKWFYGYHFKPQLQTTGIVAQVATELTDGASTPLERMARLYQYVRNLRYIAIDLGDGGYRPTGPAVTIERKYGDCKDKSTLLISMLRSLSFKAEPVLMLTASAGATDVRFPSLGFDHMIVKATLPDSSIVWLDPTVRYGRLGVLPADDQGVDVLVVHDDSTGTIERTPRTNHRDNGSTVAIAMDLMKPDTARFSIRIAYHGEDAIDARYTLVDKPDKDMPEFCKSLVGGTFANAEIQRYAVRNLDSLDRDPELEFDFTVTDALQQQGDLLLLTYDPFKPFGNLDWLRKKTRNYPIAFECPRQVEKAITISFPGDRYIVRNAPRNNFSNGPRLSYYFTGDATHPGTIEITESFRIEDNRIPHTSYDQVLQFYDAVQKQRSEKIILTKRTATPAMKASKPGGKQR